MAGSPPASPGIMPPRPLSAMVRPVPRSNSRMSTGSKPGGGSRASDEDSRTAVQVAVRVRPPLNPTDPGYDLIPQRFQRSMVQVTSGTSLAIDAPQGRKVFVFDRVFSPEVNQEGIWEYLHDCVGSFIQGYNVSLLAYGQSGAGKSYTMGTSGPAEQGDLEIMGVVPRAATALFEKLEGPKGNPNRNSMSQLRAPARYSMQSPGGSKASGDRNWSLKATYVEIYNEQLRDLLIPDHVPPHERGNVTIREDAKGNIILTGLRHVEINSVDDLMNALNVGSALRQTDATAINARSSRSHAVFSLNLVQRKSKLQSAQGSEKRFSVPLEAMTGAETFVTTDSKLHFVDLAGSERLKNTGAQGERAKEGISINAGLAALGKVISQLSSRQAGSHVSYRDSKLTRLLQDSLGGNAITYMIACVTPAEFHLSETLNTVQYAQRARAIQSKPRIQQVEEGDKQAIIDRLKAEVAFLRDQIRSAERGGAGGGGSEHRRMLAGGGGDRSERQNEREVELQNQLLDVQETYTTLSQRHAKLIAEMAKARDNELAANQQRQETEEGADDDLATERLNRSNSFAQAVEQVVLEYEKTIQSLEQSLSSTRASLSNTETSLLEKETKCAYTETINSQLQARLQKLMDREANTENYLHDLESKLDGHTSGEEKNATIIMELRKEIARVRENEAACEDYISTLEERLAEADQDAELMQREIDRLEQVVERQRSLGKLDSLLYELDHIQQDAKAEDGNAAASTTTTAAAATNNGVVARRRGSSRGNADHSRSQSHVSRLSHKEDVILEIGEEEEAEGEGALPATSGGDDDDLPLAPRDATTPQPPKGSTLGGDRSGTPDYPASPAQTKFMADKLESVTQELVDLRVEHESSMGEYDLLHAKYEEALRTLAELQDAVDEARHPNNRQRDSLLSATSPIATRPPSFLSDARSSETKDGGGGRFSSRSLSSELSSAMESPATMLDVSDAETAVPNHSSSSPRGGDDNTLTTELHRLKSIAAAKESAENELAQKYTELERKHHETLDVVEELKTEIAKAQAASSESTSPRSNAPVIRRKSSQNVMIIDRAHRSFASLRNIASENFEDQPDVMQNFELNLNAAMHELHARSERIQELEADVASARKEMETKMTIINGLTRERSSLKASPMDMAVVSNLREQLEKNEKQLADMKDAHAAREAELERQLDDLRQSINGRSSAADNDDDAAGQQETYEAKMAELEQELASLKDKELAARDVSQQHEAYEAKIAELEAKLAEAKELGDDDDDTPQQEKDEKQQTALEAELSTVKDKLQDAHDASEQQESYHFKITALESELAAWKTKFEAASDAARQQESYRSRVDELQSELSSWEDKHKTTVDEMRATEDRMRKTIEGLETQVAQFAESAEKAREGDSDDDAVRALEAKHQNLVSLLRTEVDEYKATINSNVIKVAEVEEQHAATRALLDAATKERDAAAGEAESHKKLVGELESRIASHEEAVRTHHETLRELRDSHARELEEVRASSSEEREARLAEAEAEHAEAVRRLESELTETREDLMKVATQVAFALGLDVSVEKITDRIDDLIADQKALGQEQRRRAELETHVDELTSINDTVMRDLEAAKAAATDLVTGGGDDGDLRLGPQTQSVAEQLAIVRKRLADLETRNKKSSRLVEELEDQLQANYDQAQLTNNRLSTLQTERGAQLEEANAARSKLQSELDTIKEEYASLQAKFEGILPGDGPQRTNSTNSNLRKSSSVASLPSPPPAIPLPPLPGGGASSAAQPGSPTGRPGSKDVAISQIHEDQEARIRTIEKHLHAEKQLTQTLEEALTDLEHQQIKIKQDCDAWRRRCSELDAELKEIKDKPPQDHRWSLHQVEEERKKRRDAELARAHLEERMNAISKKKKKGSLNCF